MGYLLESVNRTEKEFYEKKNEFLSLLSRLVVTEEQYALAEAAFEEALEARDSYTSAQKCFDLL